MSDNALLFPGQGAQAPGMGRDLAQHYQAARATFQAANEALDMELDRLCFEGPAEELSCSDVAQPAILTMSVAALRALAEALGRPPAAAAAAGLSLGEYTALVAAGAIDFADAVRLVRNRGLYMQQASEANPAVMYSVIGLEDGAVEEACDRTREATGGRVWPANYNSPGQVVISGEEDAAATASTMCTEAGARKTIQLKVSGAFHTPLMQSAAEKLAPLLAALEIRPPACPVVANVTGLPAGEPEQIRRLLLEQVTSPVRWAAGMRWLLAQGICEFLEIGPGRVLRGLLRRIDPSAGCRSIGTVQDIGASVQAAGDMERKAE